MTTPTKEQCVQWARECGMQIQGGFTQHVEYVSAEELHAFALKVLAEKELESARLMDALGFVVAECKLTSSQYEVVRQALSTQPSTKHLDAYVAEEVKELEKPEKTCKWTLWADGGLIYDTECGNGWMFEAGDIADNGVKFCPYCAGKIDAVIEAEKVRTE